MVNTKHKQTTIAKEVSLKGVGLHTGKEVTLTFIPSDVNNGYSAFNMKYFQKEIQLKPYSRGFHLITDTIVKSMPEINQIKIGQLQGYLQHIGKTIYLKNRKSTILFIFLYNL